MPNYFPKWLEHFTSPQVKYDGFCFFTSLPTLGVLQLVTAILSGYVVSHVVFICTSSMTNAVVYLSTCLASTHLVW